MSIAVEEILKFSALRNAQVVAGKAGLKKAIYGINIFEGFAQEPLQDEFFAQNSGRLENQVILTSFAAISDNAEQQRRSLVQLYNCGCVAVVIYFVGKSIKKLDSEMVSIADGLGLPLIVMPENRLDLRYSDLIAEVSEAVLVDRMHYKGTLVTEIIGQITKLPSERQTVDSALSMLSNKLHVSVILTDTALNVLGAASWPLQNSGVVELISEENVSHHSKRRKVFAPLEGSHIWFVPIHDAGKEPMRLFLIEEGSLLNEALVDMAQETVQLAVELWSSKHSAVMTSELVKAILNDEPIRMRRLSELLHIDIQSIHTTWLIRRTDGSNSFSKEMIDSVRQIMSRLDSDILLEPYSSTLSELEDLVIFFRNPLDVHLLDDVSHQIIDKLHELGCGKVYLTMLDYKFTTADVRNAFSIWKENEATARVVFPLLDVFHESEIDLVRQCNEIIRLGEKSISAATGCLEALFNRQSSEEFIKTLE
ncbi:MAG: PucR family transcriptional regulator ligand-binding domain-containing protein, partial [Sphaerochaetaceae bacterium]|nr:PucR family transcriptional regulator ligand-binding domain-containing protein [Sphaerochaetaceae bacterium]